MQLRCVFVIALASLGRAQAQAQAQERALTFAWPESGVLVAECEHKQGNRAFTVRSEFEILAGPAAGTVAIRRRTASITRVGGKDVPESLQPKLASLELEFLLVPDVFVRRDGGVHGVEGRDAFLARCKEMRAAMVAEDDVHAAAADQALETLQKPEQYALLAIRVQDTWDDWIGRWRDLDFGSQTEATFDGEIELTTGDVVEGTFEAKHLGPVEGAPGRVSLGIEFKASGPRLDAAALQWRQRLFPDDDRAFERVELEVRESRTARLDPTTMRPDSVTISRTTRVSVGGEAKEFVEGRRWVFEW